MKTSIEERLQIQEDIQEIIKLKAEYCRNADVGWDRGKPNAKVIESLFVEDGVWDASTYGGGDLCRGRKEIFEFFDSGRNFFGIHYAINPIIQVNGDKATGQWQLFCPGTAGEDYLWIGAIYDDRFVRTPEGWRFEEIKVTIAFTSVPENGFDVVKMF